MGEAVSGLEMQEYDVKKSLLSRGKHSVGKVIQRVVRIESLVWLFLFFSS